MLENAIASLQYQQLSRLHTMLFDQLESEPGNGYARLQSLQTEVCVCWTPCSGRAHNIDWDKKLLISELLIKYARWVRNKALSAAFDGAGRLGLSV